MKKEKKAASENEVPGYVTLRPSLEDSSGLEQLLYFDVISERIRQHCRVCFQTSHGSRGE